MKRYLLLVAVVAILIMAAADAVWPKPTPLLIDAAVTEAGAPARVASDCPLLPDAPPPRLHGPMDGPEFWLFDHRKVAKLEVS